MELADLKQSLSAALILTLNKVLVAIAIASLIFRGDLSEYLSSGIGMLLTGTVVVGALMAIFSAIPGVVTAPKTGLSPIFALLAFSVAGSVAPENTLANIWVSLLVATFVSGLFFLIIGQIKMGRLVRFIPYPVIGGFFAGFSFLLITGGIAVACSTPTNFDNVALFFSIDLLPKMLAALVFGLVLFTAELFFKQKYVFVCVVIVACGLFWLANFTLGLDAEFRSSWLLPVEPGQIFLNFELWERMGEVNWPVIAQQYDIYIVVSLMSIAMLLFDITAIESFSDQDIDLDRELKLSGLVNMLSVGAGSLLSLQTAADTSLGHRLFRPSRMMIVSYTAICAILLLVGPSLVVFLPSFVVGGLLVYLGLGVLTNWIIKIRNKLPFVDYCVIWAILLTMAMVGILQAIILGLILTMAIFVIRYSRFSVIKFRMSGLERRSNVDREIENVELLDMHGQRIVLVGLQCSIFFGTAARLLDELLETIESLGPENIDFLICDFQRVEALDTSGGNILLKVRSVTKRHNIRLVFTGFSEEMLPIFEHIELFVGPQAEHLQYFDQLDDALEWCEEQMLIAVGGRFESELNREQMLSQIFPDTDNLSSLGEYFEVQRINKGDSLFHQGDEANCLYFVLSGAVTINLKLANGQRRRLKELHVGAILGEMAFYTGGVRSADAVARSDSTVLCLTTSGFSTLQREFPILAGDFHGFVVRLLAQRLRHADEEIAAISR